MGPSDKAITVILPTYNRWAILKRSLKALGEQSYPASRWELIIVDDGSDDETPEQAPRLISDLGLNARFLRQEHRGRSCARNRALSEARSEVVLVLGDDIIADRDLLYEHADYQCRYRNTAVVGYTTWWPELEITPFMRCLEKGIILSFQDVEDKDELDYRYAYSSNISLPGKVARQILFDEEFSGYGFEDTEWGYRLQKAGVRFLFNRRALGYHNHIMTMRDYRIKMEQAGFALMRFYAKHREVERKEIERSTWLWRSNLFIKAHFRRLVVNPIGQAINRLSGLPFDPVPGYRCILNYSFYRGIEKGRVRFSLSVSPASSEASE